MTDDVPYHLLEEVYAHAKALLDADRRGNALAMVRAYEQLEAVVDRVSGDKPKEAKR